MQMLIVQSPNGPNRVFDLYGDDVTIGRERGLDMQLAHPSVSRAHATMSWQSGGYTILDSGSHNGVYVNGRRIQESSPLQSGDVITLGRFELIYISGDVPARFRKLNVAAMDRWYTVDMQVNSDATHHLTSTQMKRLLAARALLECGILSCGDEHWQLEDKAWVVGRGGDVPISGLLMEQRVAEIIWNGQNHVLSRLSRFRPVKVNGTPIQTCSLEEGDCIQIGTKRFIYEVRR
jgi:hypothetical protein